MWNSTELLTGWESSPLPTQKAYAASIGINYNTFRGALWRARQARKGKLPDAFPVRYTPLGQPWTLEMDNCAIFGDVQLPMVSETWLDLLCETAERRLRKPRKAIIAGDLLNLDAFSVFLKAVADSDVPDLQAELDATRDLFDQLTLVFDEIWWFFGNHERRITRWSDGILSPYLLATLVLGARMASPSIHYSHFGMCYLVTSQGRWAVTHARNYSQVRLSVTEKLSWKYGMNVINFHQHAVGHGFDRYGNYQILDGGGLFDADQLPYVMLDPSTSPRMNNGFVLFENGYPLLLGPDGFTNWQMVLPPERKNGNGRKAVKEAVR